MEFVNLCYKIIKYIKIPKYKSKLTTIFVLNPTAESISFNYKNYLNYTIHLFVFWVLESLSVILLLYITANAAYSY